MQSSSPAAAKGLRPYDRIVAVNGVALAAGERLHDFLAPHVTALDLTFERPAKRSHAAIAAAEYGGAAALLVANSDEELFPMAADPREARARAPAVCVGLRDGFSRATDRS